MAKLIIFDFDGTLVDSLDLLIEQYNRIARWTGLKQIQVGSVGELKNMDSARLFDTLGLHWFNIPFILFWLRRSLRHDISQVKFHPELKPVLRQLAEKGFTLGILTSNLAENATQILEREDLISLFKFVESEKNLFTKHKALKRIMDREKVSPAEVFYVGDEPRDIQASRKAGVGSIAVTWGFSGYKNMTTAKPDFITAKAEDILVAIGFGQ